MKKTLLFLLVTLFALQTNAQNPGNNDNTFNPTDLGFSNETGANNAVYITAQQSDGKIIIAGDFTTYTGSAKNRIARLNADGTLDTTFNPGTSANSAVKTIAIQSDGKIIIGGDFTIYNGTARNRIARLNTDGTLDATFNPGTGTNSKVSTTALQNDGKIIIGGNFTTYNGTARNLIARLNTDGTLDNTFNPVIVSGEVFTTAIQSDGKIIIGGVFNNNIARLNTDGSLDATFNPGTGANNVVYITALQSDGKIIVAGNFTTYNGTSRNRIARLNTDGTLDATFTPGTGTSGTVETTAIQPDGKIIIGGWFTSYSGTAINHIARLNTDGSLDATFNTGPSGPNGSVVTSAIQSGGKIIIGGGFTSYNGTMINRIARLNTDGTIDNTFAPTTGARSTVYTTAIQADGKIIIGGNFWSYNGTAKSKVARLNTDGTLDNTFNLVGNGLNPVALLRTIAIQSDGKIIIGGNFSSYNGTTINRIARLNTDGALDNTFTQGIGATNNTILTTGIQSDGKIIIGGDFTSYVATPRNRIARVNADGSLDATFNPGTGANNTVHTTSIQSDGKIIIAGLFTTYNGTSRNRIARLNTDGTIDNTFNPGTGADNAVYITALQSDGKIIIAGDFTTYNGTARNRIARLNTDGTLDATFNPGTGADNTVNTIAIQSDGKIIVAGNFTTYNGTSRNRIARLNTDGTLDNTFTPGTGANNTVLTTAIQADGKIIIGGDFTSYNGIGRNRIARINGFCAPSISINTATSTICSGAFATFTATPTNGGSTPAYQWKVNGTNAGTNATTFVSTFTNAQQVSCVLTSNATCVATATTTATSNVVTMTVNTTVTPSVIINTSTPTICAGALATFTATPTNGGATPTYQWKVNGVNKGSNSTTFVSTFSNAQLVSCVLNSNATCVTTSTVTSNVLTITVNTLPSVSISGSSAVCSGNSVTITGNGADSYTWNGGPATADYSVSPIVNTTYVVTGLSTLTGCSNTASHIVTIKLPTTSLTSHVAFASYLWNGTTFTTSGAKTFLATNAAGCDSVATLNLIITNVAGDTNGDGIIGTSETAGDINGNGTIGTGELAGDTNGDGIIGTGELAGDTNGNGTITSPEIAGDTNGDGTIGSGEIAGDTNGNGTMTSPEIAGDTNGDGIIGSSELAGDINGDGTITSPEKAGDINGDGTIGSGETAGDINGNGTIGSSELAGDTNGDGTIGTGETAGDINGDGTIGSGELAGDTNGNGVLEPSEAVGIKNTFIAHSISIYPNPTKDELFISNLNAGQLISVYNSFGTLVIKENAKTAINQLKVDKLATGIYEIIISDNNGNIDYKSRVVIQN